MENLQRIPWVSVSVLSLEDSPGDVSYWLSGMERTLRDTRIIPKACLGRLLLRGRRWALSTIRCRTVVSSRRRAKRGTGGGSRGRRVGSVFLRPYSSLPDCIATQACLQSLPLPTAQFDQIRAPSRCGSARGQEDTRRVNSSAICSSCTTNNVHIHQQTAAHFLPSIWTILVRLKLWSLYRLYIEAYTG